MLLAFGKLLSLVEPARVLGDACAVGAIAGVATSKVASQEDVPCKRRDPARDTRWGKKKRGAKLSLSGFQPHPIWPFPDLA
jgi:hypothetical protein